MDKIWLKQYPKGIPNEIDPDRYNSIVAMVEESFAKYKDKPAFANMGTTLSFGEIDNYSRAFGDYLQNQLGMKKGDRIAIMMPNLLQYPIALFGALRAGLTVVNVNPLYTARELEHQLKDSGAEAIVIVANFAHVLEKVIAKTEVKHVMVTELGDMLSFLKSKLVNFVVKRIKKMVPKWDLPQAVSFRKALEQGNSHGLRTPELTGQDLAFLQYTGGTTGVSKGAMLTHRNIVANLEQSKGWLGQDLKVGNEIVITPLPLYHIFSLLANCFFFTSIGGLNVLITNPRDMPAFVKEIGKWPFTFITGVNTLFNGLVNNVDFAKIDFSHLKIALGGGMAVQKAVAEQWKTVTKVPIIEAYGLTETSPAACINPLNAHEFSGYIGLPIPSTDASIRGENGEPVALGEPGELCLRGPQVMKGYWQRPEETKKTFTEDGWLRTGDVALMTEKGFVKLVDRKKDMILVSGFNVYPNEVEDIAALHPKVLEVAAVGVPSEKSGEVVKIFVTKKDPTLSKEELLAHCKENLAGYKRPKEIEFIDEMPKTNVGKILRRALRDR